MAKKKNPRTANVATPAMDIPIPLQEALRDSITSGSFVDTKFWLFSKRTSNPGRIGVPRALFVNERVARRISHLGARLDECKSKENLRTGFPANRKPYTTNYEYEDDSDLEEDDEDISDDGLEDSPRVATENSANHLSEPLVIDDSNTRSNEPSEVISVSDMDSLFSELPEIKDGTKPAHVGKVVVVEDVAFVTFQALLRYLYTNEIEFAPWGSTERREARALEAISESYGIPKPSPKSIYRLADKYDIPELKELALRQIQQDLSKCNIIEEVFSKYTSWYPELRDLEIRQLARTLLSADSERTLRSLKEGVESYARGQLPHAKHVISTLYKLMENDEPIEESSFPGATLPNQRPPSAGCAGLQKALTSSLTSGTFLDSQFYAVESRSSSGLPKIRPIYFCSMAGGGFVPKLMACSSRINARKVLVRSGDGYDSDIEDGGPGQGCSMASYPRLKCVLESPMSTHLPPDPALLLNCGAAKTWSAVFLHVYTGQVTFSPIGSQGMTRKEIKNCHCADEAKPPHDGGRPGSLPPGAITVKPCSPKSIYRLANKVGLTGLRNIAFKDIQSKLDKNNIIEELFSPFTADHQDVREMEYELFRSKLKPLVDCASIVNIIDNSSSGEHPHRTAAVGLILERSIEERRKRMLEKVQKASQPDPTSQPESSTKTPTGLTSESQLQPLPLAPVPVPQPLPHSSSSSILASAPARTEALLQPSTLSEPEKEAKVEPKPLASTKTNLSGGHTVKRVCFGCGAVAPSIGCQSHNSPCFYGAHKEPPLKCTGCGTRTDRRTNFCVSCVGRFEG